VGVLVLDEPRRTTPVVLSPAPEDLRVIVLVFTPGTGVVEPDGVLVLVGVGVVAMVGMLDARGIDDRADEVEEVRADGDLVRLALPLTAGTVSFRGVTVPLDRPDVVDRLGIRLGVPSSELARDRLEPWRLGGLLPARLAGRLLLRLPGRLPPGVRLDRWPGVEGLRGVRE